MGIGPLRYREDGDNRVVVGQFGLTPELLQKAGVIKPGSAPLVQALVDKGVPLAKAIPPTLFTGNNGVQDLKAFTKSVQAQSSAVQTTLKKAQCQLETAGVITGNESPVAIAGVVKAAATIGTLPTLTAIESTFGSFASPGSGSVPKFNFSIGGGGTNFAFQSQELLSASLGVNPSGALGLTNKVIGAAKTEAGKALDAIGSGNLAGKFADQVTSGLGGLKSSLEAKAKVQGLSTIKDQAQGMAAAAFSAIKDSFPKLPAGIPVNVAEEAKKAAEKAAAAATSKLGPASGLASAASGAGSALKGAVAKAGSDLQNSLSGGAAALGKAASGAVSGAAASIGGVAASAGGALTNAAGGAKGAAAVLGGAAASATGALQGAVSSATSSVNSAAASISAVGTTAQGVAGSFGKPADAIASAKGAVAGAAQAATSSLASGLSNLPGGAGAAGALKNMKTGTNPVGKVLDGLKGQIKDKASALINGLKPPTLDAAAALAKSGLPAGLAAQLESQISALGSGGGAPVKMASIALNTTDRSEITGAITSQLGDPGIPAPNLMGEISEVSTGQLEEAEKKAKEASEQSDKDFQEFLKADAKRKELMAERDKAKETLPQGDPALAAIEAEFQAFRPTWTAARDKALKSSEIAKNAQRAELDLIELKEKQDANKPKNA